MEPIYSATCERLYSRLPEIFRREDEKQDWQFKKFLSSITDQAGNVETLINRFEVISDVYGQTDHNTSDLFDPLTADPAWLDWLAIIFGVPTLDELPTEQKRQRIADYSMTPGSKNDMKVVGGSILLGDKFVGLIPHYTSTGPGGPWDLLIVTKAEETLANLLTKSEAQGVAARWSVRHYRRNRFPSPVTDFTGWTGGGTAAVGGVNGDRLIPGMSYWTLSGTKAVTSTVTVGLPHRGSIWVNPNGGAFNLTVGGTLVVTETGTGWRRASFNHTPASTPLSYSFSSTLGTARITGFLFEVATETRAYFDSTYQEATSVIYQISLNNSFNSCKNPSFETNTNEWASGHGTLNTSTDWSAGEGTKSGKYIVTSPDLQGGVSTVISTMRSHYEVKMSIYSSTGCSGRPYYRYRNPTQSAIIYGDFVQIPTGTSKKINLSCPMGIDALELEVGFHIRRGGSLELVAAEGTNFYIDGVIISPTDTVGPEYFDGGTAGYEWIGTAHASASKTKAYTETFGINEPNDAFYGGNPMSFAVRDYGVLDVERNGGLIAVTAGTHYTMGARVAMDDVLGPASVVQGYFYAKYDTESILLQSKALTVGSDYLQGTGISAAGTTLTPNYIAIDMPVGKKLYFGEVYVRAGDLAGFTFENIAVSDVITRAGAKPAGVVLWDKTFTTTWATIEAGLSDWNGWDALSWDALEMLGLTL